MDCRTLIEQEAEKCGSSSTLSKQSRMKWLIRNQLLSIFKHLYILFPLCSDWQLSFFCFLSSQLLIFVSLVQSCSCQGTSHTLFVGWVPHSNQVEVQISIYKENTGQFWKIKHYMRYPDAYNLSFSGTWWCMRNMMYVKNKVWVIVPNSFTHGGILWI